MKVTNNPFYKKLSKESNVEEILQALKSVLTDYDKHMMKSKFHNIYALSMYFEGIQRIKAKKRSSLLESLKKQFVFENGRFALTPLNKVVKKAELL